MKATAKSAALFFPEILLIESSEPDTVILSPHSAVTVVYVRDPDTGKLSRTRPIVDPAYASDFGRVEGHIGAQWHTRADPIAKKYFDERPPRFHQAAE